MNTVFLSFLALLMFDAVWVAATVLVVVVLAKLLPDSGRALLAVFRRNFLSYFINPAGYVFLVLFVMVSSAVGFWPEEFFNQNMATLGQLNQYLPIVLLFFIPSITMNIWADERRQGTDELLLTLPASDFSIVVGKFLAAGAFFSSSLLFSQLANFWVLNLLSRGDIDVGLFFTTYLGYWAMGLAMLAIGMVASFLTNSLTVAFILGVVFNAPLVMAQVAKAIPNEWLARAVSRWSFGEQFADFGRGVVSLRSVSYFTMLVLVGLYLSLALIGRRHWSGGRDGKSMFWHYVARAVSLVLIAIGVNLTFAQRDVRVDGTTERISSLSPKTLELIQKIDPKNPVLVEAFIGADVPKSYARTKVDLLTMLNEFKAKGGSRVDVRIHDDLETSSTEAVRAEQQYGIRPQSIVAEEEGALKQIDMIMGVAVTSGQERVVVPFIDRGIPVEYELVRSLVTAAGNKRLKVGVVKTDAEMFGGIDMQRFSQRPKQLIIEELEKQYDVEEVDPNNPIDASYNVLLAVQPSSLTQPQLDNLINAIRAGVPTAIFEDPMPYVMQSAPGTGEPKRPAGGMMMGMGAPPEQKGDIQQLWSMLGLTMVGQPGFGTYDADIIWQRYNPYQKVSQLTDRITDEWVFIDADATGGKDPLSPESDITSGLNQLLLLYPGAVKPTSTSGLKFTPLATTGTQTGVIKHEDFMAASGQSGTQAMLKRRPDGSRFVVAARVQGKVKGDGAQPPAVPAAPAAGTPPADPAAKPTTKPTMLQVPADDKPIGGAGTATPPAAAPAAAGPAAAAGAAGAPAAASGEKEIDVVFVSDIDLLSSEFLQLRANPQEEINFQFDNVTFVLNVIDELAKEDRFTDIRKRQIHHSSLKLVEEKIGEAESKAADSIKTFRDEFEKLKSQAEKEQAGAVADLNRQVDELREKARTERRGVTNELQELITKVQIREELAKRRLDDQLQQHQRDLERNLKGIRRDVNREVGAAKSRYRLYAFLIPIIPPLIVAVAVSWYRQRREQEGIAESRRR